MSSPGIDTSARFEYLESRAISLALVAAIVVSIADNIWHFLGNGNWAFPLIFLALLIFMRWLDVTRKHVLAISSGAPLRIYESSSEFYADALREITRSSKTVYAVFSHITPPPLQTAESRKYYHGTLTWARKLPGKRALHRVMRFPSDNPEIQAWVDDQVALSGRIENYHVRLLRYPPGMDIEGENFAIIDSSIVFLGFAMEERGELKGFSIRDARVASAFEQHFRELWRTSSDPAALTPPTPPPTSNVASTN